MSDMTPEELEQAKNATPEQSKEVQKILRKAQLGLLGTSIKFSLGIFGANFLTFSLGILLFKDSDPQTLVTFDIVTGILNFIFMMSYLNGRLTHNSDTVKSKINDVFKK